jgi:hypothetical protein
LNIQLLERYIVVLFYYSTGGEDNWTLKAGWLSEDTICDWDGLSCLDCSGVLINEISAIALSEFCDLFA